MNDFTKDLDKAREQWNKDDRDGHAQDALQMQMPVFTDNKVVPTYGLEQQILVLRSFNKTYRERINQLSAENMVLQARVSILCAMLCDAGVPLPPDIE
jgi:hypothetical protein